MCEGMVAHSQQEGWGILVGGGGTLGRESLGGKEGS